MESLEKILDAFNRVSLLGWILIGYGAVLAYNEIKAFYKAIKAKNSQDDYSDKAILRRVKELGGDIYKAINAEDSQKDYSDKGIQRKIRELGCTIRSRGDDKDYK